MAGDDEMQTGEVADLYRVDRSSISRLAREKLPYRTTPGGHRRYNRADVLKYGREVLGLDLPDDDIPADR